MNENKDKKVNIILTAIFLTAVLLSGWAILSPNPALAVKTGKCTNDCPDGTKISCEGSRVQSIDDEKNPGCVCDGEEFRCSDKRKETNSNTGGKRKKDKKKNNTNADSAPDVNSKVQQNKAGE